MKLGKILADAAGGASLSVLVAGCAPPNEPPATYATIYPGGAPITTPITNMPGDASLTVRRSGPTYNNAGQVDGEWRLRESYSNKERVREQSLGAEIAEDFMRDAARKTQRELLKGIDFGF